MINTSFLILGSVHAAHEAIAKYPYEHAHNANGRYVVHGTWCTWYIRALKMCACSWEEGGRVKRDSEDAFTAADEGEKGYLTREDYKVAILSLFGYKPSKYEVQTVWKDEENQPGLTKQQFVSLVSQWVQEQDKNALTRQVFLAFDTCCHGYLTLDDCIRAFQSVAPHLDKDRIPDLFCEVDWNEDGRVSYRDFEIMMRHIAQ